MFTTQDRVQDAIQADMERANMVEPRPMGETEPWHFSQEFRDVALRHVWTLNCAKVAREAQDRGFPRWI